MYVRVVVVVVDVSVAAAVCVEHSLRFGMILNCQSEGFFLCGQPCCLPCLGHIGMLAQFVYESCAIVPGCQVVSVSQTQEGEKCDALSLWWRISSHSSHSWRFTSSRSPQASQPILFIFDMTTHTTYIPTSQAPYLIPALHLSPRLALSQPHGARRRLSSSPSAPP